MTHKPNECAAVRTCRTILSENTNKNFHQTNEMLSVCILPRCQYQINVFLVQSRFTFSPKKKKIRKKRKKTQKHSIKQNSHKIKYYCLLFYLVPRVILWPIKRWIKSELNTHKKSFFPNSNNKGLHITVRKNEHKIYVTKAKENL